MVARVPLVLVVFMAAVMGPVVAAQAQGTELCVVNADSQEPGDGFDRADVISIVDIADFDPNTNETTLGRTGTDFIESLVFGPDGTLYAADHDQFGTIDLDTGLFTPTSSAYGIADGALGEIELDDIDGLAFGPDGTLWASNRQTDEEPDLLIQLDPSTGAHVPGAFGPGVDYLVVGAPASDPDLLDIDDLAFLGSTLYAVANLDGVGDRLVTIDMTTGDTTDIGAIGQHDMEGLTDALSGDHLWGLTGDANDAAIWHIDPATGRASQPRFLDNADDYEGFDCRRMEIDLESVRVVVSAGACTFEDGESSTPATVDIDPPGGATVEITDQDGDLVERFTTSGTVTVPPGVYDWRATPGDGAEIVGGATGRFTALACAPEGPIVLPVTSMRVAVTCEFDGAADEARANVSMSVNRATVEITGDRFSQTLTRSGQSRPLPDGEYSWTAVPEEGFQIVGSSSGGFLVDGANGICGLAATGKEEVLAGIFNVGWFSLLIGVCLSVAARVRFRVPSPLPTMIGIPVLDRSWGGLPATGRGIHRTGRRVPPVRRARRCGR